jgi:hypothetical protein
MPRNGLRRPESNPSLCYPVVNDFRELGRAFFETDFAGADSRNIRTRSG